MRRPPVYVRVAVLVAATALLGLAMCTRGQPRATPVASPPPAQVQAPADANADVAPGTRMQLEEGKMGKKDRAGFSSSKAPGDLYR